MEEAPGFFTYIITSFKFSQVQVGFTQVLVGITNQTKNELSIPTQWLIKWTKLRMPKVTFQKVGNERLIKLQRYKSCTAGTSKTKVLILAVCCHNWTEWIIS